MSDVRSFPLLRYAWASPATLVGLGLATIACALGARAQRHRGAIEVSGGRLATAVARLPARLRFDAITLGHVIVGRDEPTLAAVRDHEHVHVRQYERWGIAFFVAYLGSSLVLALRGRDPYRDNPFEREAFDVASAGSHRIADVEHEAPRCVRSSVAASGDEPETQGPDA